MIAGLFNGLFQLVMGAIRLAIQLIIFQFIPAFFFIAVWMTEQVFMFSPNVAAKIRPGLVVVLSSVGWCLLWLFVWLVSFNLFLVSDLTVWVAIAGGLWGLAVGGALAREWAPPPVIAPLLDPNQASGLQSDMLTPEEEEETISVEELFTGGIFVGSNVDKKRSQ